MNRQQKTEDLLGALLQLEKDSVRAYGQCVSHVQDCDLKTNLERFQHEHGLCVEKLRSLITALEIGFSEQESHMRGFFLNPRSSLERMDHDEDILESVFTGEKVVTHTYASAINKEMVEGARGTLEEISEQQHARLEKLRKIVAGRLR